MLNIHLTADQVHETLRKHMQVDGFDIVLDTKKSLGSRLIDVKTGRSFLDFYSFFGSAPVGMNHPRLQTQEFKDGLVEAATNNPANADVYTIKMAEFVAAFDKVGIPDYLPHLFMISGGALAVENALKTAFDWKVRKQYPNGFQSVETENEYVNSLKVIYFNEAFHGRSGYTLTMTNTFYRHKVQYFPKFDWIKAPNPKIVFPLDEKNLAEVKKREGESLRYIREQISEHKKQIACLIIEPIQAEGGDNHFRKEFHEELRKICDENEILMIYDEVQTGVGLTGAFWAHQKIGVKPDILAFGKKMQICGILAGKRIDETKGNVFESSGRINSTWGGNLTDMYRSTWYLKIIADEKLVENARVQGDYLLAALQKLQSDFSLVSNVRGSGLMCAFDLPVTELRDTLVKKAYAGGLLILKCGENTIRLRPALNITKSEIDEAIGLLRNALKQIAK
ncbi:L-lysine 6-transaminase [bacterium]|nr:MAG: L-lysine 6-transaminase [bacterium]